MRNLASTLAAVAIPPKATGILLLPFILAIFMVPSALPARDVNRLARGSCVTTHLARFVHAVRYKGDPIDGPMGTHAVFANGLTMWMDDHDERVASWLPGDQVRICSVLEPSPWICESAGDCMNLQTMRSGARAQNLSRHEPAIDPRIIACAKNLEDCPPAKVL